MTRLSHACSTVPDMFTGVPAAVNQAGHLPELESGGAGPENAWTLSDALFEDEEETDWMSVGLPSVEPCDAEHTA